MKPRQIVKDDQGNHFAVETVDEAAGTVLLVSVATKEVFTAPIAEVTVVEGLVSR